jgi:integrase
MNDLEGKRAPRIKVAKNLYKRGEVYYYRRGETEKALGQFKSDEKAIEYAEVFAAKRNALGIRAFKFRVKDVWPDYLEFRRKLKDGEIEGRKKDSVRTFEEIDGVYIRHLRKEFGNVKLADLDDPRWNRYVDKAKVGDLTNHRKVLKTFLKWCMTKGYLRALPLLQVPKVERRKRRIMNKSQILSLIEHAHGRLLLFVCLYVLMGLRWTEIRLLKKASINLRKRTLIVQDATTRTRKGRAIKITRFIVRLIVIEYRRHKRLKIDTDWLFPKRGDPSQPMVDGAMRRPWERLLRRADLDGFTPHDMRATFEYWQGMNQGFTDTQRERMAGASMDMQRNRYLVDADAEFVSGLEESVKFEELDRLKQNKLEKMALDQGMGQTGE